MNHQKLLVLIQLLQSSRRHSLTTSMLNTCLLSDDLNETVAQQGFECGCHGLHVDTRIGQTRKGRRGCAKYVPACLLCYKQSNTCISHTMTELLAEAKLAKAAKLKTAPQAVLASAGFAVLFSLPRTNTIHEGFWTQRRHTQHVHVDKRCSSHRD